MRCVTEIILLSVVVHAFATELLANCTSDNPDSVDKLGNKLVDKLVNTHVMEVVEGRAGDAQDSVDKLGNNLVDALVDKFLHRALPAYLTLPILHHTNLDDSTLGKTCKPCGRSPSGGDLMTSLNRHLPWAARLAKAAAASLIAEETDATADQKASLAAKILAELIARVSPNGEASTKGPLFRSSENRFGDVEVTVRENITGSAVAKFTVELKSALVSWEETCKRGIWLTIPLSSASCVGAAAVVGFEYHHAKAEYALLTKWLPKNEPNSLPEHGFTQIRVGGVVINHKGEVLMVQERVSSEPVFQGSWHLPGGLADADEDFTETLAREVQEETGITGTMDGVVSLLHSHGRRFGQGFLFVLVKMRAINEKIHMNRKELMGARWMSRDRIQSIVAKSGESLNGKVSELNWKLIDNALTGPLIRGSPVRNAEFEHMWYTAPRLDGSIR